MRNRWRTVGIVLAVLAAVFIVHGSWAATQRAVRHADRDWLIVGVAPSLGLVAAFSIARQRSLAAIGVRLPTRTAISLGFRAHALNTVSKSGGVAGAVVYRNDARSAGRPVPLVTAGYLLTTALVNVAFAAVAVVALGLLLLRGQLTVGLVAAVAVFTVYVIGVLATLIAATQSRRALSWLQRLPQRLRREPVRHDDGVAVDELHRALRTLRRNPTTVLPVLGALLLVEMLNISTVAVALAAFGQRTDWSLPIIAYGVSGLFAIIDPLPVGLAEASLGAVLIQFHVPAGTAAAVVATQRVLEIWLPVAVGATLSWRHRLATRRVPLGAIAGS